MLAPNQERIAGLHGASLKRYDPAASPKADGIEPFEGPHFAPALFAAHLKHLCPDSFVGERHREPAAAFETEVCLDDGFARDTGIAYEYPGRFTGWTAAGLHVRTPCITSIATVSADT